ncbi:uncharacterized protein EV420DRAFT_1622043 [Desarmillaria tabescens]|uniref:CUE domain-containing protein n=1 Tax=Armillaria tabescens TaxID=1929756 RepID=A0AA39JVL8_ARMTA|nr:uncharacterized protein EV420DRAFT_1622043 [Desarmillaria tabescens]KAK0449751.1 hypothetical protein EV420DRAFT_1622043 [Desarmillaria tabescens]
MTVSELPDFPPTAIRKSLSPSQLAILNQTIAARLQETLALPPEKRDTQASRRFVASFAQDTALQTLQPLIWGNSNELSATEKSIRHRALLLAEKLASGLELQTLLDLAIIYSKSRTRLRKIFEQSTPPLLSAIRDELVPAFTAILGDSSTGLYGIRKSVYCIVSFLRVAPEEVVRSFYHSNQFVLALARCYDQGLTAMAQSYEGRDLDDWERIFIETKVDIIDSFHIRRALAAESERTFDIIFALLDVRPSSANPTTPFLNQPLLADYQQSYDLSRTLSSALRHASEKDARLDVLESTLKSLEGEGERGPGVLKLIIRSSGIPPGVDNRGKGSSGKGKGKAVSPPETTPSDPDIDLKVSQVLDIFPDYSPDYISAVLMHPSYPYRGNPEKLIEALLEGTAPSEDNVYTSQTSQPSGPSNELVYTKDRQNVFDNEKMDLSQLQIGKKREDEAAILRDRTFMEQMKADILRRAEEISDEEEEDDGTTGAFDEEDLESTVKVGGDGEESDDDDAEGIDETEAAPAKQSLHTILELAYIQDPKQFDRDANTRRSKGRADLKAQTGWSDEQIEGWRIMLERNPKKDKILQKHEFAGNQPTIGPVQSNRGGGPSRGAGRGRGRGRGRGGRGGGGGEEGEQQSRDRAWKDKNKASRGNHNRKRGHDKKMARGGGPS